MSDSQEVNYFSAILESPIQRTHDQFHYHTFSVPTCTNMWCLRQGHSELIVSEYILEGLLYPYDKQNSVSSLNIKKLKHIQWKHTLKLGSNGI